MEKIFKKERFVQTLSRTFPVPITKPASVLPIPVANCPNAPALQVWESVPSKTCLQAHIIYMNNQNVIWRERKQTTALFAPLQVDNGLPEQEQCDKHLYNLD